MKRNCWLISQFVSEADVLYLDVSDVTMLLVVKGDSRPFPSIYIILSQTPDVVGVVMYGFGRMQFYVYNACLNRFYIQKIDCLQYYLFS